MKTVVLGIVAIAVALVAFVHGEDSEKVSDKLVVSKLGVAAIVGRIVEARELEISKAERDGFVHSKGVFLFDVGKSVTVRIPFYRVTDRDGEGAVLLRESGADDVLIYSKNADHTKVSSLLTEDFVEDQKQKLLKQLGK